MKIEREQYYTYKSPKHDTVYFVLDCFAHHATNLVFNVLVLYYDAAQKKNLYKQPVKHQITLALVNALITEEKLKVVTDKKTITKLKLLGLFPCYR